MMRIKLISIIAFIANYSFAQVGIGTTTPNASLDIVASNQATPANTDGVLIPRIDEFPVTSPGVSQDGMLVYVTGSGTPSKGFYYWNSPIGQWRPIVATASSDFYEVGSTEAAFNIGSDIYRMGNVAIGKNTATAYLDIEHSLGSGNGLLITSSGTDTGSKFHISNNFISEASGNQYAINNVFTGNSLSSKYGIYNNFGSVLGTKYGMYNNFSGVAGGTIYGTYTRITNTSSSLKYGSYNLLSGFTGGAYGAYYTLNSPTSNSSTLYGVYSRVSGTGTGMHYGIYAEAYGDNNRAIYGSNIHSSGYAGYFQGRGFFWGELGVGVAPEYRLDVSDFISNDYVTQIRNRSTSTAAMGLKIKLGNTAPTSTNYYIGFFDGADGVNGRIQGTGVGVSYQTLSDKRLKTNIQNVRNALGTLNKIQPRVYEYKELKGKKEMGFLAQELQLVYPQAVSGNPDSDVTKNPMMVDYSRLTPLLTAGVNELHEKVSTLEKENKQLKVLLLEMEKRISALEKK